MRKSHTIVSTLNEVTITWEDHNNSQHIYIMPNINKAKSSKSQNSDIVNSPSTVS
jgi:hypothetical protein